MKKIIIALVALCATATSFAQGSERDYQLAPYGFVGVQGGLLKTYNSEATDRSWKPLYGLQAGYFFTEVFGARLQGTYADWTADDGTGYDASRLGIDMDLLFNLSNLFFPGRNNLINVIGVAGVPFELAVPHTKTYIPATAENNKYTNWKSGWKGGGIIQLNLAKHWAVDFEAGTSYIAKRNNDQVFKSKWWPYALAGITYKFGHKSTAKPVAAVAQVVEEVPAPAAPAVAAPAPAPKPVVKEEPKPAPAPAPAPKPVKTTQNIFFQLGKAVITADEAKKIDEVAAFAQANPTAQISLTGYADANTGNASINQALSERRVAAVKDALVKKGVAASRINIDAKGDTVQPFSVNEQNRAVIVIGETK